jgi:hypothetical protein
VGRATAGTLSNLINGVTYYIVAVASNEVGMVSEPSNEIRWTAPGVNYRPVISTIAAQTTTEGSPTAAISFMVWDTATPADSLVLSARSSNETLVPVSNIVLEGSGTNRTVILTPAPDEFGTTSISLIVSDGALTNTTSFSLTVIAVNDPPTLNPIGNVNLRPNPGRTTVPLTHITSGAWNEPQTLTLSASHDNPALLSDLRVTYSSPASNGALSFTVVSNAIGRAIVTVSVNDGGSSNHVISRSFTVMVKPVPVKRTLYLEAESGILSLPMAVTADAAASNGLYVESQTNEQGFVSFPLGIPEDDDYVVWCRVLSANGGTDSFYVSTDNGPEDVYDTVRTWTNAWQWTEVNGRTGAEEDFTNAFRLNPRLFSLNEGSHTFAFRGREQGTRLDALLLTNDRDFSPSANTSNSSLALDPIRNVALRQNTGLKRIRVTGISGRATSGNQKITVAVASSNPAIIPDPAVRYTNGQSVAELSFAPVSNAVGTAQITVMVQAKGHDSTRGSAWVARAFKVTVLPFESPQLSLLRSSETNYLSFFSSRGVRYVVEFTDAWRTSAWTELTVMAGDGTWRTIADPAANGSERFYRMRLLDVPRLLLRRSAQQTDLSFLSASEARYIVERSDVLSEGVWSEITTVTGDGSWRTVTDAITSAPQHFYRLRLE